MGHDLSKLHPVMRQHYEDFLRSDFTPNAVPDELYEFYLDVSTNGADLIGKRVDKMTKPQKKRFDDINRRAASRKTIIRGQMPRRQS